VNYLHNPQARKRHPNKLYHKHRVIASWHSHKRKHITHQKVKSNDGGGSKRGGGGSTDHLECCEEEPGQKQANRGNNLSTKKKYSSVKGSRGMVGSVNGRKKLLQTSLRAKGKRKDCPQRPTRRLCDGRRKSRERRHGGGETLRRDFKRERVRMIATGLATRVNSWGVEKGGGGRFVWFQLLVEEGYPGYHIAMEGRSTRSAKKIPMVSLGHGERKGGTSFFGSKVILQWGMTKKGPLLTRER